MVGVAAGIRNLTGAERELMRDAGIQWLRSGGLGFDQESFLSGKPQPVLFHEVKKRMAGLRSEGFQFMGITPEARAMTEAVGKPGSEIYFDNYRRICAFLGEEFKGLIEWWQVANELDIWIFRDTLSLEQAADFLKAGIEGVNSCGGGFKVGINITLFPSMPGEVDGNTDLHEGLFIAKRIYQDSGLKLDYAGLDSYPGTWRKGGVESWDEYLDDFYALVKKPVFIQEFGYSSAGEMMSEEEDKSGVYPCKAKKWRFSWRGSHTPEVQAQFIEESYKCFARKPFLLGATYYCWQDHEECWQCGQRDCPIETAWGLLDRECRPKPSYYALKASARKHFGNRSGH